MTATQTPETLAASIPTSAVRSRGIQSIADRAMLVGLTIRQFNPVKTDKAITAEVAQSHGADVTMGRYAKSVIAKSACDKLRKLSAEIRTEHYRRTLPWAEDGARILTSTGYNDYAEFMRTAKDRWEAAVSEFISQWDDFVADARTKLGTLYQASDYPSKREILGKFALRQTVRPMPTAADFRVNLGDTEVAAIRADIEAATQETIRRAMQDVWSRMRDVVAAMATRLKAFDPNNPGEHPFRDSLVGNISELLEIIPSLNLTQDPAVTQFAEEMRALCVHDAQTLRDNAWDREDIARRADAILSQMSQFVS